MKLFRSLIIMFVLLSSFRSFAQTEVDWSVIEQIINEKEQLLLEEFNLEVHNGPGPELENNREEGDGSYIYNSISLPKYLDFLNNVIMNSERVGTPFFFLSPFKIEVFARGRPFKSTSWRHLIRINHGGRLFESENSLFYFLRVNYPLEGSIEAEAQFAENQLMVAEIERRINQLVARGLTIGSCQFSNDDSCSLESSDYYNPLKSEELLRALIHLELRIEQGLESNLEFLLVEGPELEPNRIGSVPPTTQPQITSELNQRFNQILEN